MVAAMPDVRKAVLDFQRQFAAQPPGAVLDGRDIGTVVCPDADAKLFVIASIDVRARRRNPVGFLVPVAYYFPAAWAGFSVGSTQTLTQETVLRNQPYAGRNMTTNRISVAVNGTVTQC